MSIRSSNSQKTDQSVICSCFEKKWGISVARLHQEGITTGFLSHLGTPFLSSLYEAIATSARSRVFVATIDSNPVGFIACSRNTGLMYREILMKKGLLFIALLLPRVFRPSVFASIIETMLYPLIHGKKPDNRKALSTATSADAELLSIAVDKSVRGQGVGKLLVSEMERYFTEEGLKEYRVVTFHADTGANAFYRSCGFLCVGTFFHHGNEMCEYTKSI